MKSIRYILCGGILVLSLATAVHPQPSSITTIQIFPSPAQILKKLESSAGWRSLGSATESADPARSAAALSFDPGVLRECGLRAFWQQDFSRGKINISLEILDFGDSSGAYSLFSIQSGRRIRSEVIGDQGFSSPNGLWLWQSNLVVHISEKDPAKRTPANLLEIGKLVSRLIGQRAELPNLVKQLPSHNQVPGSPRYFLGPQSFQRLEAPVQVANLGFNLGAEASSAEYQVPNGKARLLLMSYPTPQMARKFYVRLQDPQQILQNASPTDRVYAKRTGPLLALLFRLNDETAAQEILGSIHYSASLTWDEVPPQEEVASYLRTIVRGIILTGVLLLLTLGAGIAFGIIRLTVKRWVPIQIFDRPQDIAIIQLQLNVLPPRRKDKD